MGRGSCLFLEGSGMRIVGSLLMHMRWGVPWGSWVMLNGGGRYPSIPLWNSGVGAGGVIGSVGLSWIWVGVKA